MAKIISGGLIGDTATTQSNYTPQAQQQSQPEGWGGYAARNIGGAAEGFGKGIQSLVQALLPQGTQQTSNQLMQLLGAPTQGQLNKSQGYREEGLPPVETLLSQVGKPEGFGPSRNIAEAALRFGLTEAPFIYGTGGFSSLPAFGKSAAGSLGMLAGSQAGHAIGEQIGGEKGGIVGGLAGGLGGSALTHGLFNKPSKAYNKIKTAELEKSIKGLEGVSAEHKTKIKNAIDERNASIQKLRENKVLREKRIKDLGEERTPIYNKASWIRIYIV